MNFYFFGESKANTKTNVYGGRGNTFLDSIAKVFTGTYEMELQQEMYWHDQVYDLFESMILR